MGITNFEYQQMVTRMAQAGIKQDEAGRRLMQTWDGPDPVEDESELHAQIKDECRARGWLCLSGSMAHRTFRVRGEADFEVWGPHPKMWFIEAKSRTGKQTTEQKAFELLANMLGWRYVIARSMADVLKAFDE